ncbi:MAG: SufD family Fe-S cluster assembly protein [Cyanobacteria bacterium]|nr:SufD family Fe-S cluster assembly protein [Cyanobacteriota bacterium]
MAVTLMPHTKFQQTLERVRQQDRQEPAQEPAWYQALRDEAWALYQALGVPTHRHEAWKYIDLKPLQAADCVSQQRDPYDWASLEQQAKALGIHIFSLKKAFGQPDILSAPWFPRIEAVLRQTATEATPDAFTALNMALHADVLVVLVPENKQPENKQPDNSQAENNTALNLELESILALGQTKETQFSQPRLLFVLEKNASLSLMLDSRLKAVSVTQTMFFSNTHTSVVLAEGASCNLCYVKAPDSPEATVDNYSFFSTRVFQAAGSRLNLSTFNFAPERDHSVIRQDIQVSLLAENAECTLNGLSVLNGRAQVFNHVNVVHASPHCTSQQTFKGILDGQSVSEFDGTITVERHAQKTDAQQLNKNLLLSDDARVYTRPQLRIDADDVKCAHGATVGQLDDAQLFYLASRGISTEVAQCILTFGFAEDIIQQIPVASWQMQLEKQALQVLGHDNNPKNCFTSCLQPGQECH